MLTIAYIASGPRFFFLPDTLNRRPPATQAMLTASVSINKIFTSLTFSANVGNSDSTDRNNDPGKIK